MIGFVFVLGIRVGIGIGIGIGMVGLWGINGMQIDLCIILA